MLLDPINHCAVIFIAISYVDQLLTSTQTSFLSTVFSIVQRKKICMKEFKCGFSE
jgi:hypothetical protein